jgi:hypothetical protein
MNVSSVTRSLRPSKTWIQALALALSLGLGSAVSTLGATQDPQDPAEPPPPPANEPTPEAAPDEESAPPAYVPLPRRLTIAAGTIISIRTSQYLSSDQNQPGDSFSAELQQPVVVDGWVVARRGQTVLGRVVTAQKAGKAKGTSRLGIELTHLVLVDGQQVSIRTEFMNANGPTSHGADAQAVGVASGTGAMIGGIAHGGEGAAIGAAVGAGAAVAGVLLTRGHPTEIPPETVLTFQLDNQVTFTTDRSRIAFRPVSQSDYGRNETLQHRSSNFAAPPQQRPSLYPYYSSWGFYPMPFFFGYTYVGGHHHGH